MISGGRERVHWERMGYITWVTDHMNQSYTYIERLNCCSKDIFNILMDVLISYSLFSWQGTERISEKTLGNITQLEPFKILNII